tara:strand:+ start:534 stop:1046 length:513 start_codon:yes stop_codon:yes gene_type:complete
MARISNTSSYPIIAPEGADYFILTDAENDNATKNCSISNLQAYLGVDTVKLTVAISSANLQVLSTPYTILAAPGAGYAYDITNVSIFMDFNTTAFDFATVAILKIGTYVAGTMPVASLNSATDTVYKIQPVSGTLPADTAITLSGGNATVGDGTLYVNITYRKLKLDSTF